MSVAIIAASANIYRRIFNHLGRFALQCSARFMPVTVPNLTHRVCKKIAMKFDMRITKSNLKRKLAPAETSVE